MGFGGGSSYIAILILAGTSLLLVPSIALLLNIVVTAVALYNFARAGHLSLRFSLPFLSSIPFAFMAGLIKLPEKNLTTIFIVALFAASVALLISGAKRIESKLQFRKIHLSQKQMIAIAVPTGSFLGTVAGLVGIGGGIWLSPLLILTGMQDTKKTAATAALFILANSLSGLLGHSLGNQIDLALLIPLAAAVFVGGVIGSRVGAIKLDHDRMRMIVGAITGAAGITLTIKSLLM